MSSVSPTTGVSSSIAGLLQGLSGISGGLLSSPQVAAALQNAPPQDIADLSVAAAEYQGIGQLFGLQEGDTSQNYSSDVTNILANLDSSAMQSNASSPASSQSLGAQLAAHQAYAQGAEDSTLFNSGRVSALG